MENITTYEQPLNESIRVCLRLEHCFQEIDLGVTGNSTWDSRSALTGLIEILNILDRPDLKSKLIKELRNHLEVLITYTQQPGIDQTALNEVLAELEMLTTELFDTKGKFGQNLRERKFLELVRPYVNHPGGLCNFEVPGYNQWLGQPIKLRQQALKEWLQDLSLIRKTVETLLRLARDSHTFAPKTASKGRFEESFNSKNNNLLVRIQVASDVDAIPEVSLGRQKVCIRWLAVDWNNNVIEQATQDIHFEISYCAI